MQSLNLRSNETRKSRTISDSSIKIQLLCIYNVCIIGVMFSWGERKREKVLQYHNVDFEQIKAVFSDMLSIDFEDESHSTKDETRYGIIGKTAQYGVIVLY